MNPPSRPRVARGLAAALAGQGAASPGAQPRDEQSLAAVLPDTEFTLLELADRLLNRGVVLVGEATISVAGVDLIYLGLNVVLSSVETMRQPGKAAPGGGAPRQERNER